MSAAHGGQILVSEATRALVSRAMPAGASLRDLGEHRLKDLPAPERLYQVTAEGLDAEFPPPSTHRRDAEQPAGLHVGAGRARGRARAACAPASRRRGSARDADRPGRDRQDAAGRRGGVGRPRALRRRRLLRRSRARARADRRPRRDRPDDGPRGPGRSRPAHRRSRRTSGRAGCCSCSTTSSR